MACQLRNAVSRLCNHPKKFNSVNLNSVVKRCLSSSAAFYQVCEKTYYFNIYYHY